MGNAPDDLTFSSSNPMGESRKKVERRLHKMPANSQKLGGSSQGHGHANVDDGPLSEFI